jgi:hypothetical protein
MIDVRALAPLALALLVCACASDPKCPPGAAIPLQPFAPVTVAPDPRAAPSADDMAKASSTLDSFHAAAASANEEGYFALFSEGGVFLGTDGTERWTVPQFRAYAHPRFASGKAWSFRAIHRDLSVHGDFAWFDEDLDTPNLGRARGSGVLVRDPRGEWKVAQYNLSVPIPNDRFADVKRVIDGTPPSATSSAPTGPTPSGASPKIAPGGQVDPPTCKAARTARARSSPAAAGMEAQCRAAGGVP